MKTLLLITTLLCCSIAISQSIYKSSISSGGAIAANGNIQLLYVMGDVNVSESSVSNIIISEGFVSPSVSPSLSLEDIAILKEIKVFPNPTAEIINITSTIDIETVKLYDILGRQVFADAKVSQIKVAHLQPGTYLLKIVTYLGELTKKNILK